jgi:hypothetical protein
MNGWSIKEWMKHEWMDEAWINGWSMNEWKNINEERCDWVSDECKFCYKYSILKFILEQKY